jgi:hypothetical protein
MDCRGRIVETMIRNRFDQFGKNVVHDLLQLGGDPRTEQEVPPGNAQRIDVWFLPDPARKHHLTVLGGVIAKLVETPAAIELWSEPLRVREFHASMRKWYDWHHVLELRDKRSWDLPALWHVCAKPSVELFREFSWQTVRDGPRGLFRKKDQGLPIFLVMISELPQTRDTLLLRLLGSPVVRLAAIRELQNLEPEAMEHRVAYEWLVRLQLDLKRENLAALEQADQEFVMGEWLEQRDQKIRRETRRAVRRETRREMTLEHAKALFERRLDRELTRMEQRFLSTQLRTKDFTQLLDVVLVMSPSDLEKWLGSAK